MLALWKKGTFIVDLNWMYRIIDKILGHPWIPLVILRLEKYKDMKNLRKEVVDKG